MILRIIKFYLITLTQFILLIISKNENNASFDNLINVKFEFRKLLFNEIICLFIATLSKSLYYMWLFNKIINCMGNNSDLPLINLTSSK